MTGIWLHVASLEKFKNQIKIISFLFVKFYGKKNNDLILKNL